MARARHVAVVGSGHNALVCACYLARAGHRVSVFERSRQVGGAVCTEELFPGFLYDVGSSAHIMIHATPILDELQLARFGLEYLEMDPWAYYPTPDGPHLAFYRDLDQTCASIARVSAEDAEAYRRFVRDWTPLAEATFKVFQEPPTPMAVGRRFVAVPGPRRPVGAGLQELLQSYGDVIERRFRSGPVRAALLWLAAQSGPGPDERASAPFVGWHAVVHRIGARHPRGGSGMLTRALARRLESDGGSVRSEAAVERIDVRDGKVQGVTLAGGEHVPADLVVSGAHVRTTLLQLLRPEDLPAETREEVAATRVGNGLGMAVRCATEALPEYLGEPTGAPIDRHMGLQLLARSDATVRRAYAESLLGKSASEPQVIAMTFSAFDPDLAPAGKHVCYLWSQYHPFALSGGETWDGIREREADRILEQLYRFAPNMRGRILHRHIQSPLDLERRFGLLRGNVMHLEMSVDQMFGFRPTPSLSRYRTPVSGLYLTGASTHPGGGVFGASGLACARTVLRDV
jgi:phytoene dehydrogenase-like protein